ncbi:MAG: dolichyl-diphosphooligosaccharide--protein glycosyltransferase subunit 1 [Trizodia sp. TS-e1964]|nr:MAG: dolichyl-diphosphooligosaccharide--protein glycosyltransferase subunit 1 [Trizodia sp. TS-e1964]
MISLIKTISFLSLLSPGWSALQTNSSQSAHPQLILPSTFKPPQVFRNVNLLRNINLDKSYPREVINVVIENIASKPQDEYFLSFRAELIQHVGGLEVRDKKKPEVGRFEVDRVEFDPTSPVQFYVVRLPEPLAKAAQKTLTISYSILSSLTPLPAAIGQMDKQYLLFGFSAYSPSAYTTLKQKTKLKFPTTDILEYDVISSSAGSEDPQKQGPSFTYGPYGEQPAGAQLDVTVHYEFTKPLIHITRLERDIEISHWGGNLAIEERYWLTNKAAKLSNHFSRVSWATTQYYNPPSAALKELRIPLSPGSMKPYFTDDIGNVSTSRFRSNLREANLELKPRYPVFGGWSYSFRVGWDAELHKFLRKLHKGDGYILKVPFLEGPKQAEGVQYERVEIRAILPEGAINVQYQTAAHLISAKTSTYQTFLDTKGRTTLTLTALNVLDDARDIDLIITYDYPLIAGLRKPLSIFFASISLFVAIYFIKKIDVSIGKRV